MNDGIVESWSSRWFPREACLPRPVGFLTSYLRNETRKGPFVRIRSSVSKSMHACTIQVVLILLGTEAERPSVRPNCRSLVAVGVYHTCRDRKRRLLIIGIRGSGSRPLEVRTFGAVRRNDSHGGSTATGVMIPRATVECVSFIRQVAHRIHHSNLSCLTAVSAEPSVFD